MKIFDEYNASKKDSNYTRTRQEFQYLHEKLAHIKTLVHQYDTKTLSNSDASQSRIKPDSTSLKHTHTPCIMMVISLAYVKYLSLSFKVACVVTSTTATNTDLSITRTNNLTESKQEHVGHTCRTFVDVCKCVVAISFSTAFFIKLILYWATFFLYFCFCIIVNILRNFSLFCCTTKKICGPITQPNI